MISPETVDRKDRSHLVAAIRRFLNEEITAFEFDELLMGFHNSRDSAVRFVAGTAWYHYDDCKDHLVSLSKREWDYFQRLLLLLESGCRVQSETVRRWSWSQLIACVSLVGFVWIALQTGWGYHLIVAAAPLGLVSIGISWRRRGRDEFVGPYEEIVFPFGSYADLKSAYNVATFKKARYPKQIRPREARSPIMHAVYTCQFYVLWLMLSPIALAFQMLPERITRTRAVPA